jgi:hypothetical protein
VDGECSTKSVQIIQHRSCRPDRKERETQTEGKPSNGISCRAPSFPIAIICQDTLPCIPRVGQSTTPYNGLCVSIFYRLFFFRESVRSGKKVSVDSFRSADPFVRMRIKERWKRASCWVFYTRHQLVIYVPPQVILLYLDIDSLFIIVFYFILRIQD